MAGISLYSFIIQALGGIVVKTVHSLEDAIQDFGGFEGTLFVLFRSWDLTVHFLSCINLLLNPKNSKLYPLKYISRMTIHKLVSKFCRTTELSSHSSWVMSTIFQSPWHFLANFGDFLHLLLHQLDHTWFWRIWVFYQRSWGLRDQLRYHLTGADSKSILLVFLLFWRFFEWSGNIWLNYIVLMNFALSSHRSRVVLTIFQRRSSRCRFQVHGIFWQIWGIFFICSINLFILDFEGSGTVKEIN